MEKVKLQTEIIKFTWMLKKLVVWGWKQQWKGTNRELNLQEN